MGPYSKRNTPPTLQQLERMSLESLLVFWKEDSIGSKEYRLEVIKLALHKGRLNAIRASEKKLKEIEQRLRKITQRLGEIKEMLGAKEFVRAAESDKTGSITLPVETTQK